MPMGRGAFSALLTPELRRIYEETGKERPLEYPMVFNVENMDWNPQTDRQISGLGTMPAKNEGEQFSLDERTLGGTKSYEATPFGLAVEVTWEMWRDDLYGPMREFAAGLARASRNRQEVTAWSVLNNAFNAAFTGFTAGEPLCSVAHTGIDGVVRSNRAAAAVDLSVTGLQSALTRFENLTDERGLPMLLQPSTVVCGPASKFVARNILGAYGAVAAGAGTNDLNTLIEDDLSFMVSHYFTDTDQWFLIANKQGHDLNFLWRDRPVFDSFDDPWTKNAIFTSYQRHTSGFGSWRGVDGDQGVAGGI